ncbi:hypothetical protein KFU94_70500 [Chloroflexi bacterium TSY]|nr:hypothetical protein [Chloroflexi bacterium TSY]
MQTRQRRLTVQAEQAARRLPFIVTTFYGGIKNDRFVVAWRRSFFSSPIGCSSDEDEQYFYPSVFTIEGDKSMATYLPKTLFEMWKKGELTIEMAIGHVLQRLLDYDERLRALERQANQPSQESDRDAT